MVRRARFRTAGIDAGTEVVQRLSPMSAAVQGGVQFFDDRTYVTTQSGATDTQHFSMFAADRLRFELNDIATLTITLNTWGNIKHSVSSPTCNGNVMTGYVSAMLYAFTFRQLNLTLP